MRPLPPAPFLKDPADALRDANVEGQRQFEVENPKMKEMFDGLALAIKHEQEKLAIKRKREQSSEDLFVAQDPNSMTSTCVASTTLSSGRFAGLQSARKRVRATISPNEKSNATFDSVKASIEEAAIREDVNEKKGSAIAFGPAKKVVKKGGVLKNVQLINTRAIENGPEFYAAEDTEQTFSRSDLQDLKHLHTLVKYAMEDAANGKDLALAFNRIGQRLQQIEFHPSLCRILIMKSRLLNDNGLRAIFENRVQGIFFPYYLRADAQILFRKWTSGQIDPHLLRGLDTNRGKGNKDQPFTTHSLQKSFSGKVSCNYVGAGELVNGQWWPLQKCALRDGAHGETEAGIHGQKEKGAYSIVISGGGYANIDNGNTVKYCGTQGRSSEPSVATDLMRKAHDIQQPLRVLRSASLPATNQYRPTHGIRYNGLYRITSHEILDQQTSMYRFTLSRLGGQDPIRYQGEGKSPSSAQILELNKIRLEIG